MPITDVHEQELKGLGFTTLQEACTKHKLPLSLVYDRWIRHGWSLQRALATPRKRNHSERRDERQAREQEEIHTGLRACIGGCEKTKPLEQFRRASNSSNGHDRHCFECRYFYNTEKTYGLTRELFYELWERQGQKCFGCLDPLLFTPEKDRGVTFHVEHDHRSGKIRGLACIGCNSALAAFDENPSRMRKALDWIDRPCPIDATSWEGAIKSTCTGSTRGYTLWNNHGLTPADFEKMLEMQQGVCGICELVPRTRKGWAVDHHHGRREAARNQQLDVERDDSRGWRSEQEVAACRLSVRGVLCDNCNKALGQVRENKETLLRLAKFLEDQA